MRALVDNLKTNGRTSLLELLSEPKFDTFIRLKLSDNFRFIEVLPAPTDLDLDMSLTIYDLVV